MRHAWVRRVGMVALVGAMVLLGNTYTASGGKPVPPPAPTVPRVVDATDKLVGQVVGTTAVRHNPIVALNISVPSITVEVTPDHLVGNAHLWFTTPNCSGQPYFNADGELKGPPHVFPIVGVVNGILYGPRASSTPATIVTSSFFDYGKSGVCDLVTVQMPGIIADPISDLSTQFTPPYRYVYP